MNLRDYFLPGLSIHSFGDLKNRVNNSDFGDPLHGLKAGYEMTKLGSAYRLKQGVNRINDGQNPFSSEFIKGTANDQGNNVADAWKDNWPVILAMVGGALGGGSSATSGGGEAAAAAGGGETAGGVGNALVGGSAAGGGAGASSAIPEIVVTGSHTSAAPAIASIGAGSGVTLGATTNTGGQGNNQGSNWQDLAKNLGSNMQQQAKQEDDLLNKLAAIGPPPLVAQGSPGVGQDLVGKYQQLLPGKPPVMTKTRGEAATSAGV